MQVHGNIILLCVNTDDIVLLTTCQLTCFTGNNYSLKEAHNQLTTGKHSTSPRRFDLE